MAPKTTTRRTTKTAATPVKATSALTDNSLPSAGSMTVYQGAAPLPEHRPVGTSSLKIAGTYGNVNHQRPIEASSLRVVKSFHSPGIRPITATEFEVVRIENSYGSRPIGNTVMPVSHIENAYGTRPIGPNSVDEEPKILMGYLD